MKERKRIRRMTERKERIRQIKEKKTKVGRMEGGREGVAIKERINRKTSDN